MGRFPSEDLYEVDPTTGQIIARIGNTGQNFVSDIDFLGNTLYVDYWDGQGRLGFINTATGLITAIGPFGLDPFDGSGRPLQNGGLGVNPNDGTIYAVESSFQSGGAGATAFFKVNPLTGAAFDLVGLNIGGIPANFGFDALEITPGGRFLGTRARGSSELYEINPATGELTLIPLVLGSLDGSLNGLESSPIAGHLIATTNVGELVDIDLGAGTAIFIGRNFFDPGGNVFNGPAPTGGNFWNTFDDPAEGCIDQAPIDGFCDAPFVFNGGQDDLPWTIQNGWITRAVVAALFDDLQDIVDNNPNTALADKLEDVRDKLQTALAAFDQRPPGNQAAVGNIEGAVGDLEAAVSDGLLDLVEGSDFMDQLVGVARQLASDAVDEATACNPTNPDLVVARQSMDTGDALRASGLSGTVLDFKNSIAAYKDALAKGEGALNACP